MLRSNYADAQNGQQHFTEQAWDATEASGPDELHYADNSENCGVSGNAHAMHMHERQPYMGADVHSCMGPAGMPGVMSGQVCVSLCTASRPPPLWTAGSSR